MTLIRRLTPFCACSLLGIAFEAMAKPHCAALTQEALIQALEALLGLGDGASPADESAALEAAQKLLKPHAAAFILGLQRVVQQQQTPPKRPSGAAQRMKVAPLKISLRPALGLIFVYAERHAQPLDCLDEQEGEETLVCTNSRHAQAFCTPAGWSCVVLPTGVMSTSEQDVFEDEGRAFGSLDQGTGPKGPRATGAAGLPDVRPAGIAHRVASKLCTMPVCFVCCPGLVLIWTKHVCRQSGAQSPIPSDPSGMKEARGTQATTGCIKGGHFLYRTR